MKTIKFFTLVIVSTALLAACTTGKEENTKSVKVDSFSGEENIILSTEQFRSSGMALGKVTPQLFSERIRSTGRLDVPPQFKASVSAYYGGTVKNLHLLVGQEVDKGAALFTLENPDYVQMQQDYLNAKNRMNYLKAEYERQKKLLEEKVASRKNFLKAEADYRIVVSDFRALEKKLRLLNIDATNLTSDNIGTTTEIQAPISGFITEVNITKGEYLSPNEVAVGIVNTEHMHLELNVFENDIAKIKKGQSIRFRFPDNGTGYFEGEVFLVGRAVYSDDRSINVHGHLKDETQSKYFIPGMYIEAEILIDEVARPALPSDAIVNLDNAFYVLVKKSFKSNTYAFEQRQVKVGQSNDGYTEIVNAKELGNSDILIKGAFNMIQ